MSANCRVVCASDERGAESLVGGHVETIATDKQAVAEDKLESLVRFAARIQHDLLADTIVRLCVLDLADDRVTDDGLNDVSILDLGMLRRIRTLMRMESTELNLMIGVTRLLAS